MKLSIRIISLTGSALLLASCNPGQETSSSSGTGATNSIRSGPTTNGQAASPTFAERTGAMLAAGKAELSQQAQQQMTELDRRVASLREKAAGLPEAARSSAEQALVPLQEKRSAAENLLSKFNGATADAWQELKVPLETALREFRTALENAEAELAK